MRYPGKYKLKHLSAVSLDLAELIAFLEKVIWPVLEHDFGIGLSSEPVLEEFLLENILLLLR